MVRGRQAVIAWQGRHHRTHWPALVAELEASYQAVRLAKTDQALGLLLLRLRLEGITWAETLERMRQQSLR